MAFAEASGPVTVDVVLYSSKDPGDACMHACLHAKRCYVSCPLADGFNANMSCLSFLASSKECNDGGNGVGT